MSGFCYTLSEPGGVASTDTGSNHPLPLEGKHMAKTHPNLRDYIEQRSIPEPNSGCWLWLGYANSKGYGKVTWRGTHSSAHRLAWIAMNGPIPIGMQVCHKCDNPRCVNPEHLWLGTNADNVSDKTIKGRQTRGAEQHDAILTDEMVRRIRTDGRPQKVIAAEFGVSQPTISNIKRRWLWKHVV